MDPNACLQRIIDNHNEGEREEMLYAIDDLAEWIGKGGFVPASAYGVRVTWSLPENANYGILGISVGNASRLRTFQRVINF